MQQEWCPLVRHRAVTKSGDDNKAEEARSDCKVANQSPEPSWEALTMLPQTRMEPKSCTGTSW